MSEGRIRLTVNAKPVLRAFEADGRKWKSVPMRRLKDEGLSAVRAYLTSKTFEKWISDALKSHGVRVGAVGFDEEGRFTVGGIASGSDLTPDKLCKAVKRDIRRAMAQDDGHGIPHAPFGRAKIAMGDRALTLGGRGAGCVTIDLKVVSVEAKAP